MARMVDGLAYVGPSLFGPGQDVTAVRRRMEAVGIDVTVAVPARPPEYHLGPANQRLAEAQAASGGALVGLARVDPNQPDGVQHLTQALDGMGLHGLFLHPAEEHFRVTDPRVVPLLEFCADRRKPVVVAAGYPWLSEALQVASLASRFPTVDLVMTNGGQFNISGLGQFDAELALTSAANIRIQTTGVYRQDFIERVTSRVGADRVMFAGGSPDFEPRYEILRVTKSHLSGEARAMLLGGTASRVFGL